MLALQEPIEKHKVDLAQFIKEQTSTAATAQACEGSCPGTAPAIVYQRGECHCCSCGRGCCSAHRSASWGCHI